ncbi:hypothetical protein RD792_006210 [Penstemon davidsonii]|uniref:Uncharacterized protein n=1 Tax=Penstemon davidsonii TaxID=160366 RepID=A0ABR0DCA4_9LAMI|nr:hypothetical protein RD792_006210 [Penstemon davidsonii]
MMQCGCTSAELSLSTQTYIISSSSSCKLQTLCSSLNSKLFLGFLTFVEVKSIATMLGHCAAPCNFLVFGITHETLLWDSLNRNGRTIIIDELSYLVSKLEEKHPYTEVYDVLFTTKVSELYDLIEHYRGEIKGEYRQVQNLLFSDRKLAMSKRGGAAQTHVFVH